MNDSASAAKPAQITIPLNVMAPLHVWIRLLWEHRGPDPEYRKRLAEQPIAELERIHQQLGIEGWDDARMPIEAYLKSLEGYQKNVYPEDPAVIARVNEIWRFAVDEWQYRPPAA